MTPSEKIDDYARGWSGLMKLVRNGHSWSGSERNRFFLNGQNGNFHEMSHLAGLDQIEDGRGLAIVDWDQDGRLDLWYRNRNAPRLRLMLNRRESPPSLAIKLEGTKSNRDGIGAIVELLPALDGQRAVQSVKAGDLFLSQSSKTLHFGLGQENTYTQAAVTWPGGEREVFHGIDQKGGRFLLKQGTSQAIRLAARPPVNLKPQELSRPSQTSGEARIILPARVLFPEVTFRNQVAQSKTLPRDGKPRLLLLWSASCPHCQTSLKKLSDQAAAIRAANLDVLALSTDALAGPDADTAATYTLIDQTKFPFAWGTIDTPSAARIHHFQETLFDRTPAASVPLAILLDENQRALAIYRGELPISTILQDWKTLQRASDTQLYHLAPPLHGSWFTNPLPRPEVDRIFRTRKN